MNMISKLSQLLGALGGGVQTGDPVETSFMQWAMKIQEQLFTRWQHVATTGIPCAKRDGRSPVPCAHPAVSTCRLCRQPTCLAHAAVSQNGEIWCLPCMAYSEQVLRAHLQGRRAQQPAPPPNEAALRKEKAKKLGLGEDATPDEVKAAFRKLSLKYHPDRHVSATPEKQKKAAERYREITEAYHWLAAREKKAA